MSKTTFGELASNAIKELSSKLVEDQSHRRGGKGMACTIWEVQKELSVNPPATAEEALTFCRLQIKRCNVNLANAKDRGDKRAIINLERKLAVYEYLYKLVKEAEEPKETVKDCPSCRVYALENGVCACCGYSEEPVTTSE